MYYCGLYLPSIPRKKVKETFLECRYKSILIIVIKFPFHIHEDNHGTVARIRNKDCNNVYMPAENDNLFFIHRRKKNIPRMSI